jgi:hypothetical protein
MSQQMSPERREELLREWDALNKKLDDPELVAQTEAKARANIAAANKIHRRILVRSWAAAQTRVVY